MERIAEIECERSELNLGSRGVSAGKNCSNNALPLNCRKVHLSKNISCRVKKKIVLGDRLPQEIFEN